MLTTLRKIQIKGFGDESSHPHKIANILKESFKRYCSTIELTENSEKADIILIVGDGGIFQEKIRQSKLYKTYGNKCILFCTSDNIVPIIPGLYASSDRRYCDSNLHVGGFYVEEADLNLIQKFNDVKVRYLFSFMGNCQTHQTRGQILLLSGHERGLLKDVGNRAQIAWSKWDMVAMKIISREYSKLIQESKFVLCPRGNGTTSIRLFETMKLGKVPVIISDNWVPPTEPDWDQFSIRVKENDILGIPDILEKLEDRASEMGERAELEWNKWFSERGSVKTIMSYLNAACHRNDFLQAPIFKISCMRMKYYVYNLINRFI